jgi:hypothetical protein
MRLFTLALPLAAALLLAGTASAARPTTEFTGTPQFTSTPSAADPGLRDVSLTVTFTHQGPIEVKLVATVGGNVWPPLTAIVRGATSSHTWTFYGTDKGVPGGIVPGTQISYSVQLVQMRGLQEGNVLAELPTFTYTA